MNNLNPEIFFDYTCPYCLKGHRSLQELLPSFPNVKPSWRPCEAHPRPERHGAHSDLLIQAMFLAEDAGADMPAFHAKAYEAAQERRIDIESEDAVSAYFAGLLDAAKLREALQTGRYQQRLQQANDYAYGQSGVWAVPAYRLNGQKLDSVEGVGVTTEQLRRFLEAGVS